jgi:TATA-box binding protein (TBP) (component of TFIID and TFIIIB)
MSVSQVDQEWESFISEKYKDHAQDHENDKETCDDVFLEGVETEFGEAPIATDIYISTKSKIAYLNQHIDLKKLFWGIRVIPYWMAEDGIIKKQMKFNSVTQEELDAVQGNLKDEAHFEEHVLTSINNPAGRIKFKDIRKISVGISKKDLMSYRCKPKSAFYNCFVMIMRIRSGDVFKEFHIKVFNTGKMEIPGVQNDEMFQRVLDNIISTMQPFVESPLGYNQKCDTVLINSNFNCGFYINREALFDIMKYKYGIQCIYDPCSYPGIQCKFYYNRDLTTQNGRPVSEADKEKYRQIVPVSFMIFRTGSVLIVGMCDEQVLYTIYDFLKDMLTREYGRIHQKAVVMTDPLKDKDKKKKVRRKSIFVEVIENGALL